MDYLPDVNIIGGYANQTDASYIQDNFTYLGITANYTFFEWGKKNDVLMQRQTDVALARQNLNVTRDKVLLEARKAYLNFDQALQAYRLAGEMAQACQDAEKSAASSSGRSSGQRRHRQSAVGIHEGRNQLPCGARATCRRNRASVTR